MPSRVGLPPLNIIPSLLWQAVETPEAPADACLPEETQTLFLVMSEYYIIVKTFNNGSLGSGIDEERSEMR